MRKSRLLVTSMALVERYAQLQRERDQDLILVSAYYNETHVREQARILAEVADKLLDVISEVLEQISWVETYFGGPENLHSLGILDEIMGTAITAMHVYPNRYNLLVDYIPDATFAVVLCDIGDSHINHYQEDWDSGLELGRTVSLTKCYAMSNAMIQTGQFAPNYGSYKAKSQTTATRWSFF